MRGSRDPCKKYESFKIAAANAKKRISHSNDNVTIAWLKSQVKEQSTAVLALLKAPPGYEAHLAAYSTELQSAQSRCQQLTKENESLRTALDRLERRLASRPVADDQPQHA